MGWFMAADPYSLLTALFVDHGTPSMRLNDQFDAYRSPSSPEPGQRMSDHPPTPQTCHSRRAVAGVGKNGVDVGAELRRHAVELAAAMSEPKAIASKAQFAIGRFHGLDRVARFDLRMVDDFLDAPDAGAGGAGGIEDLFPLLRALGRELVLDRRPQRRLVLLARIPVDEAWVVLQVLQS